MRRLDRRARCRLLPIDYRLLQRTSTNISYNHPADVLIVHASPALAHFIFDTEWILFRGLAHRGKCLIDGIIQYRELGSQQRDYL